VARRRAAPEVSAHAGAREDLISVLLPGKILTADALLVGSCGRTDLPNGNAPTQYHMLYYVLKSLPDGLLVYPGHDYEGRGYSTLGEEKESNPKMNFLRGGVRKVHGEGEPRYADPGLPARRRPPSQHGVSRGTWSLRPKRRISSRICRCARKAA
jgi:hypothetical protein